MSEQDTNFGKLTTQEFEQVMNEVAAPDFHDLATEGFFAALGAIDAETPRETLELTASVTNGQLTFLEPAPRHAHGNEIQLGDKTCGHQTCPGRNRPSRLMWPIGL